MWSDELSREGLTRSRISTHIAVASAIYAWALVPSRRYATSDPLRLVELPPNDEKPRLRVAFALEAEHLLEVLAPKNAVPYAIAFYAGLRRAEIHRLEWPELLEGQRIASRLLVTRAKSEAGRERRPPVAEPLRRILRQAWLRQGARRAAARSRRRSCPASWRPRDCGVERSGPAPDHAARVPPHVRVTADGRGYTLKALMEFMGHADLQMVNRYGKLLPQPGEEDLSERLTAYLRRATEADR